MHRYLMMKRRDRDSRGILTLDVLIGITLFSLVVVLAIQSMSGMRARGYKNSTEGDAQKLSTLVQSRLSNAPGEPINSGSAGLAAMYPDFHPSDGNRASVWVGGADLNRYIICVHHESGAWARYISDQKRIAGSGTSLSSGGPCTLFP